MLVLKHTLLEPFFVCPDGTRLTMRDDALPHKVQTRIDTYHQRDGANVGKLATDTHLIAQGIQS